MTDKLFESCTEISTGFVCDNCHISIDRVEWKRCTKCKQFDLCHNCENVPYENLPKKIQDYHKSLHAESDPNEVITNQYMSPVGVEEAIENLENNFGKTINSQLNKIRHNNRIDNDYQMNHIIHKLKQLQKPSSHAEVKLTSESGEVTESELLALIGKYYTQGHETNINILSLDGGGTRGHMSFKVLCQLITEIYPEHNTSFIDAQSKFIDAFDYLVGTSTGGLIAFCLAVNHDLSDIKEIYEKAEQFFKRQWLTKYGPVLWDKYDPTPIYNKIDYIIDNIPFLKERNLSAKDATLLDIHNLLNPHCTTNDPTSELDHQYHSNWLEFDDNPTNPTMREREKVLLITAYNTTNDCMTIFNTSYSEHWGYRIADVLKATMAAPTYFRPCTMYKRKKNVNGIYERDGKDETFLDGGVFANDPELAALWAIRMQWKKPVKYHLMCIGTGRYNAKLSMDHNWNGGYKYWLLDTKGLLVNVFMDGTRSLTETITNNLAKFDSIKRIKFNYKLTESMELDDPTFAVKFNAAWDAKLKDGHDYKTLLFFYKKYIQKH
ncbi:unnamed protein product [Adineta steineri]|uniref:PNPLA domain-containing protein n=1 Tax=Adineta steineri TaxID=433720 RepID=A0A814QXJ1_9BILA|nr:unnamed protein product [Adineta steineri]CAF1125519.1 unnamed protein product [Adineta steineri]